MHRAEKAISDTKTTLNGSIVIALVALTVAAAALVVAIRR
jgi:hypothetical protein